MHPKASIQRLARLRDKLNAEAEALRLRVEGIELSIAELQKEAVTEEDAPSPAAPRLQRKRTAVKRRSPAPRGNVKSLLNDLLKEVGDAGLNAAIAVQMATARGEILDRNSVSSLLSRWKNDNVLTHENDRYRLKPPVAGAAPLIGAQKAA